jgi:hypothetical protein
MKRAIALAIVSLVGCATVEPEANKTALLNSAYFGLPLSEFMLKNGTTPDSFSD